MPSFKPLAVWCSLERETPDQHALPRQEVRGGAEGCDARGCHLTEAVGDVYTSALIELGLILFVITFIVLAASRLMLMRVQRRDGA